MERIIFDNTLKDILLFAAIAGAGILVGIVLRFLFRRVRFMRNISMSTGMLAAALSTGLARGFLNVESSMYRYVGIAVQILFISAMSVLVGEIINMIIRKVLSLKHFERTDRMSEQIENLLSKITFTVLFLIALSMILNVIGINVMSVVTGLGIGGLAVALAAQDFLANIIGGITIFSSRVIQVGDFVSIDGNDGTVVYIGMRTSKIQMLNGRKVIIPNKRIMESVIVNHSYGSRTLVNYVIGVAYSTSFEQLKKAVNIIRDILENDERIPKKPDLNVGFYRFDTYSLNIYVNFYVKKNSDIGGIKEDFHFALKEKFDKEGIEIAFPTSTIFLQQRSENDKGSFEKNGS